jgi:thioredoxin reductase
MPIFAALIAGLLFGAGLVISGMAQPANVIGFLDVTGDWSPRLMFVMVGARPNTGWLSGLVTLDDKGFVLTGEAVGGASPYATSRPGIYAVGDVRAGSTKRVASSVGEGSVVISKVWEHVRG